LASPSPLRRLLDGIENRRGLLALVGIPLGVVLGAVLQDREDVARLASGVVAALASTAVMPWWLALSLAGFAIVGLVVLGALFGQPLAARLRRERPPPHEDLREIELDGVLWLVVWRPGAEALVDSARPLCAACRIEMVERPGGEGPVLACEKCHKRRVIGERRLEGYRKAAVRQIEAMGRDLDAGRAVASPASGQP
jgi:hypothetical protein